MEGSRDHDTSEIPILPSYLPWRWIEDIEVQILFYMMRTEAPAVLPTAFVLSGRLLDEMGKEVEDKIEHALKGRSVTLS